MVLESIYFYPRFNISMLSLFISMIWVFNNDYVDYILKKYPYYDFIQTTRSFSCFYRAMAKYYITYALL